MKRSSSPLVWGATLFTTPGLKAGLHVSSLLSLVIVMTMVLVPLALYRRGSKPSPPDSDADDGWGKKPEPPKSPPPGPQGGIPLDDALPARTRLRGPGRLAEMLPARSRRRVLEPERRPVRETPPS